MPDLRRIHRTATQMTSIVLIVLGLVMVTSTVLRGGGPLATGVLFGVLVSGAGAARYWLERDAEGDA